MPLYKTAVQIHVTRRCAPLLLGEAARGGRRGFWERGRCMYYRVLVVHPRLQAEVVGEGLGARCALRVGEDGEGDGERVDVPLEVAALLWLADGVRTVEAIHEIASEGGATLSLERVERELRKLQDVGLVAFQGLEEVAHRLLPGTVAHACEGCGRSCEGHLVGPLPPSEVATIQGILPQLQTQEPTLAGKAPFMAVAQNPGGVYLRLIEGRCIFLDGERRCMIHKHIGPAFKPSICRMFPYTRVLTEEGYRFAIAPGCFRHHTQPHTEQGAPQEMAMHVTERFGAADVTLTRLVTQGEQARTTSATQAPTHTPSDDQLVVWLGEPGTGLGDLLGWLTGEAACGKADQAHQRARGSAVWCAWKTVVAYTARVALVYWKHDQIQRAICTKSARPHRGH